MKQPTPFHVTHGRTLATEDTVMTSLRMPGSLHKRLKAFSKARGRPLSQVQVQLLQAALDEAERFDP